MKRFYFTNENGDNVANDHTGNIRGARTVAQRIANERQETITINDCTTDDMIDLVYPNNSVAQPAKEGDTTIDFDTPSYLTGSLRQGEEGGEQITPNLDMRAQDLLELYQLSQLFFSTYGDRLTPDSTHSAEAWISFMGKRYKAVTGGEDITMATNPRNAGRPPVYSDEQNNRILDLRGEGLSLRRIAEEVNCSLAHVQRVLERQNQ